MFLSIFLIVFRRFEGEVSICGVRVFFLRLGFSCPCGAIGFPPREESVGVRQSSCVSRLGMFLPIVFSVF